MMNLSLAESQMTRTAEGRKSLQDPFLLVPPGGSVYHTSQKADHKAEANLSGLQRALKIPCFKTEVVSSRMNFH